MHVVTSSSTLRSCVILWSAGGNQCNHPHSAPIQIFFFHNLVDDSRPWTWMYCVYNCRTHLYLSFIILMDLLVCLSVMLYVPQTIINVLGSNSRKYSSKTLGGILCDAYFRHLVGMLLFWKQATYRPMSTRSLKKPYIAKISNQMTFYDDVAFLQNFMYNSTSNSFTEKASESLEFW